MSDKFGSGGTSALGGGLNAAAAAKDAPPRYSPYETSHSYNDFLKKWQGPIGQRVPIDKDKGIAMQFPNIVEKADPRDNSMAFGASIIDESGVIPGVGMKMATQSDVDYFYKKTLDAKEAGFRAWFLQNINVSTPEAQDYWLRKYPEVFEEKKQLMMKQLKAQETMARINITGFENLDDFRFIYAVQNGEIAIPDKPLYDPAGIPTRPFHQGLFNISRWFDKSATVANWKSPMESSGVASAYTPVSNFANFGLMGGGSSSSG